MKIHRREENVRRAEYDLRQALIDVIRREELTTGETLRVVSSVFGGHIDSITKFVSFVSDGGNSDEAWRPGMTRRTKTAKPAKRPPKQPEPVVDECEECQGLGTVQATCENCNVYLTTANWKPEYETYACTKCVEAEEAHERNLPRDSRHRSS